MRKAKSFLLLAVVSFLSSCAFSYSKGITIETALQRLSGEGGALKSVSELTSNRSQYGIGLSKEVKAGTKESHEFEEKSFCVYRPTEKGFSFDYFTESVSEERFRTVVKGDSGILVSESFNGDYRPFDEEKDGDLKRFFDFPNDYVRYYMENCLQTADEFLRSIIDPDAPNSLTSFSALSKGEGNLSLFFEGKDLPLSYFDALTSSLSESYDSLSLEISNNALVRASFGFTFENENATKGSGDFALDFELR